MRRAIGATGLELSRVGWAVLGEFNSYPTDPRRKVRGSVGSCILDWDKREVCPTGIEFSRLTKSRPHARLCALPTAFHIGLDKTPPLPLLARTNRTPDKPFAVRLLKGRIKTTYRRMLTNFLVCRG